VNPSPLDRDDEWFVVGLGRDFLLNDCEQDAAAASLLETLSANKNVVGFFCDLDYSFSTLNRAGFDRESQLQRLSCTCQAAAEGNVAIQIRTSLEIPSSTSTSNNETDASSAYSKVMKDLTRVLSVSLTKYQTLNKVHLSSWSGKAEDMISLLNNNNFADNVWFGFDSTVTFAKASHIHECAFDVPLDRILLETGANTIPSVVTKAMGREAFSSSGLVPFIAQAIADIKKTDAAEVARDATRSMLELYPQLAKNEEHDKTLSKEVTAASGDTT
jgi:Tat protein secretion system quality control protein TatD with DNase activity